MFEGNIPSTSANNVMHNMQATHVHKVAHPVHVRSGSCPSQLLQSLPVGDISAIGSGGAVSSETSGFLFGSKRIKGHGKERPSLQE